MVDTDGGGMPPMPLIEECGWPPSTSMLRFMYSSLTMAPEDEPEGCRLRLDKSATGGGGGGGPECSNGFYFGLEKRKEKGGKQIYRCPEKPVRSGRG